MKTVKRLFAVALAMLVFMSPARAAAEEWTETVYSVEEIMLLAAAMELENGMNSDLCVYLTGTVILNRVRHPRHPNTIKGVLFEPGQYAKSTLRRLYTVKVSDRVLSLALRVVTHRPIDKDIIFQSMYPNLGKVKYIIDGEYFATE